jgi:hypothetical protein
MKISLAKCGSGAIGNIFREENALAAWLKAVNVQAAMLRRRRRKQPAAVKAAAWRH